MGIVCFHSNINAIIKILINPCTAIRESPNVRKINFGQWCPVAYRQWANIRPTLVDMKNGISPSISTHWVLYIALSFIEISMQHYNAT